MRCTRGRCTVRGRALGPTRAVTRRPSARDRRRHSVAVGAPSHSAESGAARCRAGRPALPRAAPTHAGAAPESHAGVRAYVRISGEQLQRVLPALRARGRRHGAGRPRRCGAGARRGSWRASWRECITSRPSASSVVGDTRGGGRSAIPPPRAGGRAGGCPGRIGSSGSVAIDSDAASPTSQP